MDSDLQADTGGDTSPAIRKKQELTLFLLMTIVLAPLLSIAIVGGYGFVVWISQMLGQ